MLGYNRVGWARSGSDWHLLALAGTYKQTFSGYRSLLHARRSNAMLVEPFMVLVIEHMPRRVGWLPLSPSASRIRRSVTLFATTDFGYAYQVRSAGTEWKHQRCFTGSIC